MQIFIENMVSQRCIMLVMRELRKIGINYTSIEMGRVVLPESLQDKELQEFKLALIPIGLRVIDEKNAILIERIKGIITEMVHGEGKIPRINFSYHLSERIGLDYNYMSNVFSGRRRETIQHYITTHKIERIKELLLYDELSLTEISHLLHYSSLAHLSNQFKMMTRLTPSAFKKLNDNKSRIALEDL